MSRVVPKPQPRARKLNTRLNEFEVNHEHLRTLKQRRSALKGSITRKTNDIESLMSSRSYDNKNIVKEKLEALSLLMREFETTHREYQNYLKDEVDIEESNEYFQSVKKSFINIDVSVQQWIYNVEKSVENQGNFLPHDSASVEREPAPSIIESRSSSRSSKLSSCSSISSLKAKAIAKRAMLESEAKSMMKLQAIEEEEFRLQQRKKKLEIQAEIEKAAAEEQAYVHAEEEENNFLSFQVPPESKSVSSPSIVEEVVEAFPSQNGDYPACTDASLPPRTPQASQAHKLEELLVQQQQHTLALTLPQPEMPVFSGDAIEYCNFIRAFENLIEKKTADPSARLYYLVQYTTSDVQELMKSCLMMTPTEGYLEARKLLKDRYGSEYKIASAFVERLTMGQPIKSEDGHFLQRHSILLASCKNTLAEIGYLSKVENPDSLRGIVQRLPYGLRRKLRDVADRKPPQGDDPWRYC